MSGRVTFQLCPIRKPAQADWDDTQSAIGRSGTSCCLASPASWEVRSSTISGIAAAPVMIT